MEPCGWAITKCGCGSCWNTYTPEVQATASALAIGIMWAATARRYGQCAIIVQPCVKVNEPDYRTYPLDTADYGNAYIHNGAWYNTCGAETTKCCTGCELDLEGPTTTTGVTKVLVDGIALPASSYQIMNGHILVRTDGVCWPTCINYSQQNPPSLQVEYLKGLAIPERVQVATERLACEFAKACVGAACALPRRLKSITRQGVEATVADLVDTKAGSAIGPIRTGIPEVDMIIQLENPRGRQAPSIIWSPDSIPPRVLS